MTEKELNKNELFLNELNEYSKLDDSDYKFDCISELIYSIQINRLLDENLPNILNSLDKIEDNYLKRDVYNVIVDSIQIARLLKEKFSILLDSLEKIEDEFAREHGFETLLFSIRGEPYLWGENFTSILHALDKFSDVEAKRSAFHQLTSSVRDTYLSEESITGLLNYIDTFSGKHKIFAFCDIICAIKFSNLLEEEKIAYYSLLQIKFPDILNVINTIDDDVDKRRVLSHLMFNVRKTTLN